MTNDNRKRETDEVTGIETTGHEWDGIKELNRPAPRWWLWVFAITVVWSIGYWVVYPAWPTLSSNTEGKYGWTSHRQLSASQSEIMERRAKYLAKFNNATFDEILHNKELYVFAVAGGRTAFKDNCATCHGTGGAGSAGYPNLNDDDWLWGGDPDTLYQTIRFGVRSGHDETRISDMPAFGDMLSDTEISAITDYVKSLGNKSHTTAEPTTGSMLFAEHCAVCHGESGRGDQALGAPNLADAIWFYGGDKADIMAQIREPKHGVMPHWSTRLDDATIRQLTIYVHSLGGGD